MTNEKANPIEAYRVDVYGNVRGDFDTCLTALNAQADNVALVCRAIAELGQETANDEHTQVLTATHDTLRGVLATMNAALVVLADCGVE